MPVLEKHQEYGVIVAQAIVAILEEEGSITYEELQESSDNATAFMHAVATIAPIIIAKHLGMIAESDTLLDLNHLANKLIFQFDKE